MINEPNKLVVARTALNRAEVDLTDPNKLSELKRAINSLLQLISGVSPLIEKDIGRRLVMESRSRVLSEVRLILPKVESYEPEYLEHLNNVMEMFVDANLPGDPEFSACKEQLLTKCRAYVLVAPAPGVSLNNSNLLHADFSTKKETQAAGPQNDFYLRKNGEVRRLPYAKSLRAIGHSLEMLHLRAFELEKAGDFYVVRSASLTETHEWILKNNLAEQSSDSPIPDSETTQLTVGNGWLCYGPLDIARLNARERKKKDNHVSGFEPRCETDKLAQLLATLGEHLDIIKAIGFEIAWAPDAISVEYHTSDGAHERKSFTPEKLQQLALGAKFRRSRHNNLIGSR
jgi:hypothetical protein